MKKKKHNSKKTTKTKTNCFILGNLCGNSWEYCLFSGDLSDSQPKWILGVSQALGGLPAKWHFSLFHQPLLTMKLPLSAELCCYYFSVIQILRLCWKQAGAVVNFSAGMYCTEREGWQEENSSHSGWFSQAAADLHLPSGCLLPVAAAYTAAGIRVFQPLLHHVQLHQQYSDFTCYTVDSYS